MWGYPADAPGADADALPSPWERARDAIQDQDQDQDVRGARRAWLVFTGTALVPHAPPAPPPVPDPRALPSPLYYAHIAAPPARPTFARLRLPVPPARLSPAHDFGAQEFGAAGLGLGLGLRGDAEGDAGAGVDGYADADAELESLLKLVRLPTRVRSPHSPSGVALAKRYVWLARLPGPRRPAPVPFPGSPHSHPHLAALPIPPFPRSSTGHCTADREADAEGAADGDGDEGVWAGVGEGWRREWVLQAEGTVEGRTALLDALRDSVGAEWEARDEAAGRVWEMDVERAAAGCVWLRYVSLSFALSFDRWCCCCCSHSLSCGRFIIGGSLSFFFLFFCEARRLGWGFWRGSADICCFPGC